MGSQRLPGKVMLEIDKGRLVIDWVIQRVRRARTVDKVVLATSTENEDSSLVSYVRERYPDVELFRGSKNNVLSRFQEINHFHKPSYILRITADCPLVCPKLIDEMFIKIKSRSPIYAANCNFLRIIKGFDLEFISGSGFCELPNSQMSDADLEHVTPYFYREISAQSILNFTYPHLDLYSDLNLSVDTKLDLDLIRFLAKEFQLFNKTFSDISPYLPYIHMLSKRYIVPCSKN